MIKRLQHNTIIKYEEHVQSIFQITHYRLMGYIMKSVYMSKLMIEFPFYLCMGVYKHAGAGEHKKLMRLHLLLMPP